LDEELEAWHTRPLGEVLDLYQDARYKKVRQTGRVRDTAISKDWKDLCGYVRQYPVHYLVSDGIELYVWFLAAGRNSLGIKFYILPEA